MSKIIVTGSEGYIGSKLAKYLEELGHEVCRIDWVLGTTVSNTFFRDVDFIYHLAAQTDVQYSRNNPHFDAINNIGTTIEVIKKYPNVPVIYAASAASLEYRSPYGLSKKVCEEYIKMLCPKYVLCRIPNPWGDGGHGAVDYFFKSETIKVNGEGLQSRTIIHVQDIVKAFIKAMEWETGEYNLGGGEEFNLTVKEISERVAKKTGKDVVFNLSYDPIKEGEVFAAILPNTTPNWQPEIIL